MSKSAALLREDIEWCNIWIPDSAQAQLSIPRILLIGDSITGGYGPHVKEFLAGKVSVARLETSRFIADPVFMDEVSMVLRYTKFDLIHFNNGLHGFDNSDEIYAETLPKIVAAMRKMAPQAKWILANNTRMRVEGKLEELHPRDSRIKLRNSVMEKLAAHENIPLNNLFDLVRDHPEYYLPDAIHFHKEGYAVLGRQVAGEISKALGK